VKRIVRTPYRINHNESELIGEEGENIQIDETVVFREVF
jgi:hypothetical protein